MGESGGGVYRSCGHEAAAEQEPLLVKALESYRTVLSLKPDVPAYLNNYAVALARVRKADEAQAALEKVVKLDPANTGRYYYNLGAILNNSDQGRAAIDAFRMVPASYPQFADAQAQMFRLTLSAYIESASSKFQALTGKQLYAENDTGVWDANLLLPGAQDCGIAVQGGNPQFSCTFATGQNKDQLRVGYEQLVSRVRISVPSDWKPLDLERPGASEPSYPFTGPRVSISVSTIQGRENRSLSLSVLAETAR